MAKFRICVKCGQLLPIEEFKTEGKVQEKFLRWFCTSCKKRYEIDYAERHKEEIAEKRRLHVEEMAQNRREYTRCYTIANIEKITEYHRQYARLNKEKVKINGHNYRSRKLSLPSTLTETQWDNIKQHFNNRCAYCGRKSPLAQEHFLPISKGGEYTINNIIPSCKSCNSKKHNNLFNEWYTPILEFYDKGREKDILSYLKYKNGIQQLAFA